MQNSKNIKNAMFGDIDDLKLNNMGKKKVAQYSMKAEPVAFDNYTA